MRALVTGASGVVGRSLVRHLLQHGDEVVAYLRKAHDVPGVQVEIGELSDVSRMTSTMSGADVVYHVAGVNQLCPRDTSAMYAVNVGGTQAVLEAAANAGVPRLVHTSSVAVDASSLPSHYARSKAEAEQVALNAEGVDVVVVRPASVQGPGRSTGSAQILLDAINGRLPVAVDATISVVDIDDCAAGHRAAAIRGVPSEVYTLSGFTTSIRDALGLVENHLGRQVTVRFVPSWVLWALVPVGLTPRLWGAEPKLCAEMVRTLSADHRYDGRPAAESLSFSYRSPTETIGRLIDWFRSIDALD